MVLDPLGEPSHRPQVREILLELIQQKIVAENVVDFRDAWSIYKEQQANGGGNSAFALSWCHLMHLRWVLVKQFHCDLALCHL